MKSSSSKTTDEATDSDNIRQKLEEELEGLSSPCEVNFTCSVALTVPDEMSRSTKQSKTENKSDNGSCGERREIVAIELRWNGKDEHKDQLHQIVQYLQNKMSTTIFSEPENVLK